MALAGAAPAFEQIVPLAGSEYLKHIGYNLELHRAGFTHPAAHVTGIVPTTVRVHTYQ